MIKYIKDGYKVTVITNGEKASYRMLSSGDVECIENKTVMSVRAFGIMVNSLIAKGYKVVVSK